MVPRTRHRGFDKDFVIFTEEDIVCSKDDIKIPTLVIHDVADPRDPVAHVDWFASMAPRCQRVNVRTVGHLIWAGPDADLMHRTRVSFLREHV